LTRATKKRLLRWTLILVGLPLVATVAIVALTLGESYRGFDGEKFLRLERGTGTKAMARALADAGVIRYPWQFWAARALAPSARLQAGEYRFSEPATVREVFHRIERGDVYYFEFTVPEGSNIFDISTALEAAQVMPAADFLHAAENPAAIRDLAPKAQTQEGFLFPSTYRLTRETKAAELCRMMTDQFRKQWKRLGGAEPVANILPTVTLASLVEKETSVAAERPLVAGVFRNRLEKRMRLGCDPTTIYAALLEHRYSGTIHRSDLASANPYNTYQHEGLPPGPIANPGASSLQAALHPAETEFMYFVAKAGGGGHVFSKTLTEHEKSVGAYRRGQPTKSTPRKNKGKAG
jgi:UPF0755 protein